MNSKDLVSYKVYHNTSYCFYLVFLLPISLYHTATVFISYEAMQFRYLFL